MQGALPIRYDDFIGAPCIIYFLTHLFFYQTFSCISQISSTNSRTSFFLFSNVSNMLSNARIFPAGISKSPSSHGAWGVIRVCVSMFFHR
jgi:hypothetical protein